MGHVVVGGTAVVFGIEDVRQRHRAVVVGVEVDGAAERVRMQEGEVIRGAALELDQQAVVFDVPCARQRTDRAQRRRDRRVRPVDVLIRHTHGRRRLIEVGLERRILRPRPGIRGFHHIVGAELTLHVHVEVVGVGVAEIGQKRRTSRAGGRHLGMDSGRGAKPVRQQDVGAEVRCRRLRLQERLVLRLRR